MKNNTAGEVGTVSTVSEVSTVGDVGDVGEVDAVSGINPVTEASEAGEPGTTGEVSAATEVLSIGLELVRKRLPRFMEWLESNWESARPLEARRAGKYDWLVDGDTPMVDDYVIEGGNITDPRHTIWMIIGLGTGKALQKVLEKAGNHVARILLVEEDAAVWKCAMMNSPLRQIMASDDRIFPVWDVAEMKNACSAAISNPILLGSANRTLYFLHRGATDGAPEKAKEILKSYSDAIQFRFMSLGNSAEDTLIGFSQIVRNYPNLLRSSSLDDLENKFSEYAAIIVSAGPSLEKNIHLLKDVQDKCIIIAVDTVLRKLLPMGITPHFVVAIERDRAVYDYHFVDLPTEPEGVIPVICSVCLPEVCGTWRGPFIMSFKTLPLDAWFASSTGLSTLPSGSSCAHMAIPLALKLGCKKIALIGQDLAYSPEGVSHSEGTAWSGKERQDLFNAFFPETFDVPAALGGTVKTNAVWLYFKQVFESFIAENKGAEFIDATEGGALIHGTRITPLRSFFDEAVYPKVAFSVYPKDLLNTLPLGSAEKKENLKAFLAEAAESLDIYLGVVGELESDVARVTAPGLSSGRRREKAFAAAARLDALISVSPIMTFILQAHIAGVARVINECKFLETSDELKAWRQELDEFVGTARTACTSARSMLITMVRFIDEEPLHQAVFTELGCPEGLLSAEDAERAWEMAGERSLLLFPFSLFSRFDFRKGLWASKNALELGRRSLELGFVERARKLLSSLVQNEAMCSDPSFWNDLAVSYCLYEFGTEPDFESARSAFIKAMVLDSGNEERSRNYLAMEYMLQKHAEAVYNFAPSQYRNKAAATIGNSWFALGKTERAEEWFQRALNLAGDDDVFRKAVENALGRCRAATNPTEQRAQVLRQFADTDQKG